MSALAGQARIRVVGTTGASDRPAEGLLIRQSTPGYCGLRGEGSNPVPLPPLFAAAVGAFLAPVENQAATRKKRDAMS